MSVPYLPPRASRVVIHDDADWLETVDILDGLDLHEVG